MNSVHVMGRIVRDLEPKYLQTGTCLLNFSIAVDRPKKKGEAKAESDFISCIAWNKSAEIIGNYFKKGDRILIEGRIQTGSYENKDGKKVYTTDVVVEKFEFVEPKSSKQQTGQATGNFTDFGQEDIMF